FPEESAASTTSAMSLQGINSRPPVPSRTLFQNDLLHQFGADDFPNFGAFVRKLLGWLFAAENRLSKHLSLGGYAVQGSVVLVFDRKTQVPIFGTVPGLFEEYFIVHDHSLTFLLIKYGFAGLAQTGEISVDSGGLNPDQ